MTDADNDFGRLMAAARAVVETAAHEGCSDDLTVCGRESVEILSRLLDSFCLAPREIIVLVRQYHNDDFRPAPAVVRVELSPDLAGQLVKLRDTRIDRLSGGGAVTTTGLIVDGVSCDLYDEKGLFEHSRHEDGWHLEIPGGDDADAAEYSNSLELFAGSSFFEFSDEDRTYTVAGPPWSATEAIAAGRRPALSLATVVPLDDKEK